ncbi:hypothetical protein, partial [Brochothrix thermosphacta]|uniref:hypothetical protein n=1 Tax=Brochothrix thermosphacta TaxID=2756 RepID=UPI001146A5F7
MKQIYKWCDVANVAELTAFMYAGALQHPALGQKGSGVCLDHWGGHTGFVSHCTTYAAEIDEWLDTREDEVHPGVMLYELIEPMGEWLLEMKNGPPENGVVLEYFKVEYLAWIDT